MAEILKLEYLDRDKDYSYADYLLWKFKERVELIRGKIFEMSPAPTRRHQKISMNLSGIFYSYLDGKRCECYASPFDVRLAKSRTDSEIITVVQPDLCVVCDPEKLDERGCVGAPDLIIEILSKGNNKRELKYKFDLYEENGVREYWIIRPEEEEIQIYILENNLFRLKNTYYGNENIEFSPYIFPNMKIRIDKIF